MIRRLRQKFVAIQLLQNELRIGGWIAQEQFWQRRRETRVDPPLSWRMDLGRNGVAMKHSLKPSSIQAFLNLSTDAANCYSSLLRKPFVSFRTEKSSLQRPLVCVT